MAASIDSVTEPDVRRVLGPIDAILIFIAIRHYGKAFRQRIEEGE